VEIHPRPFVSHIYPLGLPLGHETEVQLVGTLLSDLAKTRISIPAEHKAGEADLLLPGDFQSLNPVSVVLT
jgi:hypothetical protein